MIVVIISCDKCQRVEYGEPGEFKAHTLRRRLAQRGWEHPWNSKIDFCQACAAKVKPKVIALRRPR